MKMQSEQGWEKIWQDLETLGAQYAQAKAQVTYLSEFRKSKKSILMKQAEVEKPGLSGTAQEREAYANPEYILILEALRDQTEIQEAARYKIQILNSRIEVWRTRSATRRAEASLR